MSGTCLIRCEYSETVGYGHLVRCLTLAGVMKKHGLDVWMLSSHGRPELHGDHINSIDRWCITTSEIGSMEDAVHLAGMAKEVGAKLLVLDFYHISEAYQQAIRQAGLHWLQFDGFADRPLWADWVLSMSPAADRKRYALQQRNPVTKLLLGPGYAVLRPEFARRRSRPSGDVSRVLLSFGGGDDRGMTMFCLNAIKSSGWAGELTVVVGRANPSVDQISSWAKGNENICVKVDEPDMADVMSKCDMAVVSGGMITFEAAAMGLPSLMICLAENQKANIRAWSRLGVSVDLGDCGHLGEKDFIFHFLALAGNERKREALSLRGMEVVDGRGATRVVEQMLGRKAVL